jgi:hypothetical protein
VSQSEPSYREKALAIFRELAGERVHQLSVPVPEAQRVMREALADNGGNELIGAERAADIAFHMTDWNYDAAFITAFLLFPERFTADEIRGGIEAFLGHAPNHLAAAAKLHDYPIEDIFEVGALDGWPKDDEPDSA